jgi:outer membrane protein assembly factor BamB
MDQEKNIKMAHRVALISGVFCGVVALLLFLKLWHLKQHEPMESASIEAYLTSRWQIKTGTYLLLVGGIVLAISLKIFTNLRVKIEQAEKVTEAFLRARANAQYLLFIAGGLVLGLSLVSAVLSNDYLKSYQSVEVVQETEAAQGDVEVGSEVIESNETASASTTQETLAPSDQQQAVSQQAGFSREDFKKNQAVFRGYMGLGVSYHKNIPINWNGSTMENIKWKVPIGKRGFNTPVIWGGHIFLSGGDNQSRIVACYNRHTGQLVWEKEVKDIPGSPASPPRVTDSGLAAPTMAVDGKQVYAIFATGDVVSFDLKGNKVWGRNLGVPSNLYGHSSSLQVWENKLIIQYDTNTKGRMLVLNTSTGESIWDVDRPVNTSWASPALIEVDGKIQIVTSSDPFVMGHDLQTGAEIWRVEAMMGEVGPSVAYEDGLVFATNEYARLVAVEPKPGTEYTWDDDEYLSEASSPVAYGGLLYLATSYGVLVCYDTKTGEKQWEKEFDEGFYSSPMIADGKLYIIDLAGITHILKAGREGTVISEPDLGEGGYALPVFADGAVYLRGTENLYCIEQPGEK